MMASAYVDAGCPKCRRKVKMRVYLNVLPAIWQRMAGFNADTPVAAVDCHGCGQPVTLTAAQLYWIDGTCVKSA